MIVHTTNLITLLMMEKRGAREEIHCSKERHTSIVQEAGIILWVLWYIGVAAAVLGRKYSAL